MKNRNNWNITEKFTYRMKRFLKFGLFLLSILLFLSAFLILLSLIKQEDNKLEEPEFQIDKKTFLRLAEAINTSEFELCSLDTEKCVRVIRTDNGYLFQKPIKIKYENEEKN